MFNFDLSQDIEIYLLENCPTREFDIIRYLQSIKRIPENVLQQSLSMFRCHFLIFNCLYRLKIKGHLLQQYSLDISSLQIRLVNFKQNHRVNNALDNYDPLACFYLDFEHVNQMDELEINKLLDNFWQNYFTPKQHSQALKELDLTAPVDIKTIKKQYRRLVMRHHPDRGGDPHKLVAINQAMSCLKHYYPEPSC